MRRLGKHSRPRTLRYVAAFAAAFALAVAPAASAKPKSSRSSTPITAPKPDSPLILVVSIKKQRVRVFDADGQIAISRISSGRPGFSTPTGVFTILEKNVTHRSNIYSGASMPFMERVTWSGIALHAGVVPGFRASHGCVRLPYSFARRLYGLTKIGNRVVIAYDDPTPVAFTSPKLFKPLPLDDATALKMGSEKRSRVAVNDKVDGPTSDALEELPLLIGISPALARAVADMPRDPQRRPTTRAEADQILHDKLASLQAALKTAQADVTSAQTRNDEANKDFATAKDKLQSAEKGIEPLRAAVKSVESKQQQAIRAFEEYMKATAAADTKPEVSPEREIALENAVLDATRAADASRKDAAISELNFAEVQARYSAAKAARDAAADAVRDAQTNVLSAQRALADANKEARLRSKPISVFVSLRAQRIYVRQGFEPVLEAPIAINAMPGPVGTHVFTAMRYAANPNTFDWRLTSAQTPSPSRAFLDELRKRQGRDASSGSEPINVRMAQAALSTFTIPDDILAMITERARPGASLIVSDRELPQNENGSGTEFVVLTK
ncbi:L,D-transpeptidase family protein [Hyphomicrobium sp.]|uniref:L,D-transpeptidase family protein n=1 Tax=Hyphomicrobium sp. TaxID=82 RepID=UPI002C0EC28E|nr:L,D-transpeptidase family protein [Hyphomicrobium sp.]HVZ03856.1 L,D-transpeptidase family protein [Hyphomicrobium sp.]